MCASHGGLQSYQGILLRKIVKEDTLTKVPVACGRF